MIYDYLQASFWFITYILIILFGLKSKHIIISFFSVILNLSWETIALLYDIINKSYGYTFVIHLIWLIPDIIILLLTFLYHKNRRTMLLTIFPILIFQYCIFMINDGQLIISFIVDLIMAILFLIDLILLYIKKTIFTNPYYISLIAFSKFLGDIFAWIQYSKNEIVFIIGIIVLVINTIYIVLSSIYTLQIKNTILIRRINLKY